MNHVKINAVQLDKTLEIIWHHNVEATKTKPSTILHSQITRLYLANYIDFSAKKDFKLKFKFFQLGIPDLGFLEVTYNSAAVKAVRYKVVTKNNSIFEVSSYSGIGYDTDTLDLKSPKSVLRVGVVVYKQLSNRTWKQIHYNSLSSFTNSHIPARYPR